MIRITPKAESSEFDRRVRQPGLAFLRNNSNPTAQEFKKKNYWKNAINDLNAAYDGLCAYSAMYLPDGGSVDHFFPKSQYPNLAYEWSNYRLSNPRINNSKGNSTDIADPFQIHNGWFQLDLPSCLIKPDPSLERDVRILIKNTINTLRLNSDDAYVNERCRILIAFALSDISEAFLGRRYPFLHSEVVRQGVRGQLTTLFSLE